jgi:hypothetical protein
MSDMKNQNYWPHPADLRHNRMMKRAMKDLPGGVGYGAIVLTMERLRCEPDFSYPIEDLDLLADEFDISLPILQTVISKYGFFEVKDDELLISPTLNTLMKPYKERKKQAQLAGKISAHKRKLKQEKQLKELSLIDSSERSSNERSTEERRGEEKRRENIIREESRTEHITDITKELNINSFLDLKTFMINNRLGSGGEQIIYVYKNDEVSISDKEIPYFRRTGKNLTFTEADSFYKYMFENLEYVIEKIEEGS